MANINTTYQQINTFSVNRQAFLEAVVYNESLTENDTSISKIFNFGASLTFTADAGAGSGTDSGD